MKTVLGATALFFLASAAPALSSNARVGATGGFTVPLGDFADTNDPNMSLSAFLTGPIRGGFDWRLETGYDRASTSDLTEAACALVGNSCDNDVIKRFVAGAQYNWNDLHEKAKPYTFFTMGAYNREFRQFGNPFGINFTRSETDLGIGFGGGVNWDMSNSWGIGVDLHIHGVFHGNNQSDTWYLTPAGMIYGRF